MNGLQFLKLTYIIIGLNFTSILHGRYNALQVHRPQSLILDTTDCATQPSYYFNYKFRFDYYLPDVDFKLQPPVNVNS